ncbi:maleylpyruvate isomerase family mycothiol-dependent enzyme [Nocardioides sp. GXQ0305]|uniref:maleylpyruvate isomerase family mycothiol-dependent enzyme n=1 Tax=Nocardioides sp. GXQ0305 TaxID=3423912 RepID=UPI003D7E5118
MTDSLGRYIEIWWQAVHDFTRLLEEVPEEEWSTPTDLPGWTVFDVAAHVSHLESMQAGHPHEEVEIGEPDHVHGMMGVFTEQGVVARRGTSPDTVLRDILACATARHTQLLDDPPTDGSAPAAGVFGAIGWTVERLLRNRPLDVWLHEQDVRRAVGRPGNLDGPGAIHTADYLAESLGFVLGKRVGAPAGTTLVLQLAGHPAYGFEVGDDGRGRPVAPPADPTVQLTTDRETFVLLAAGRREARPGAVQVEGDAALAEQVLASLAVTP